MPRQLRICRECERLGKPAEAAYVPKDDSRQEHLKMVHEIVVPNNEWKSPEKKQRYFRSPSSAEAITIGAFEASFYEKVRSEFARLFSYKFGGCHLEVTAQGHFSEKLKDKVKESIVFSFIKRMKGSESRSPDITGFSSGIGPFATEQLVTIEFKDEPLTLWHVYQAKMYAELFNAQFGLLVSTKPIPTELKKLHKVHFILNRFMHGAYLGLVEFDPKTSQIVNDSWFPEPPFRYDPAELLARNNPNSDNLKLRKAEIVDPTHARLHLENGGIGWITINKYAIGNFGTKPLIPPKPIEAGESGAITIPADPSVEFERGKYYDIRLWTDRGTKFSFGVEFRDLGLSP